MDKLTEGFEVLEELLRQVSSLISPMTHHDDIERLTPEFVKQDSKTNKKCYIQLGGTGRPLIFPVCSRNGAKCPDMIKFSLKYANKMVGRPYVDQEELQSAITRMQAMHKKYNKEIPNTNSQAHLKRISTQRFNQNMK